MPAEGVGGGVGEMGFRVGPFDLCKHGCWRRRRRNTHFGGGAPLNLGSKSLSLPVRAQGVHIK